MYLNPNIITFSKNLFRRKVLEKQDTVDLPIYQLAVLADKLESYYSFTNGLSLDLVKVSRFFFSFTKVK